ncbi:MAG: hypothetical protein ABEH47_00460 [Haloferacaceae archaeon]
MSGSEPDARVKWLDDPPPTWKEAPEAPPTADADGPEVSVSYAGGLLLRESGSRTRFLFDVDPVEVRP